MEEIIVKVGYNETMNSIAKKYNLTTKIISLANDGLTNVEEGDYLIIPYKAKAIHIVRPLETLKEISIRYNKSVEDLKKDNKLSAPLFIGQQLVISEE